MRSKEKQQEALGQELARKLDDFDNLPIYRSFAARIPELLLRSILDEVMEIPERRIRKSRGALFTYLVRKYGLRESDNHRN